MNNTKRDDSTQLPFKFTKLDNRQIDNKTTRQLNCHLNSQSQKIDNKTNRQQDKQTTRQIDNKTNRQQDKQTTRQVDNKTNRYSEREIQTNKFKSKGGKM